MCMYLCYLSGGGVDYGPLPMECTPLFFFNMDSQHCCVIPIINDNLIEGTESFAVTLTSTDSSDLIAPVDATVSITDNDGEFAPLYPLIPSSLSPHPLLSIPSSPPLYPLIPSSPPLYPLIPSSLPSLSPLPLLSIPSFTPLYPLIPFSLSFLSPLPLLSTLCLLFSL